MMKWHRRGDQPVDTHVLVYHSRQRPHWLDQCLASLENEPTNILLVDDTSNNVGYLRALAHREGNAPFLSFVDDDDWVVPGAFQKCLDAIKPGIVGAYTDFADVHAGTNKVTAVWNKFPWDPWLQLQFPFEVLHVHVYRRDSAMKYLDEIARWVTLEESLLMGLMVQDGDWSKVDFLGYYKRAHNMGAGSRITDRMRVELTNRLNPILLPKGQSTAKGVRGIVTKAAVQASRVVHRAVISSAGCGTCKKTRARVAGAIVRKANRLLR